MMPYKRRIRRDLFALASALAVSTLPLGGCALLAAEGVPLTQAAGCESGNPSAKEEVIAVGWERSYLAGCPDRNGRFAGGSQVMHLVAHKGNLYAANGYWMDRRNIVYGGSDPNSAWGQVLRLSGPREQWTVDLELGPRHLRTELLKSLTFSLDHEGRPLPQPETLLVAATYGLGGNGVSVFVRNDETGSWTRTMLINALTGKKAEDNAVRAAAVYRDRVTGREQAFISVGTLGVFTGAYDPVQPGKIKWASAPEIGPTYTRILAIVEANDSLLFSEGRKIYRRIDGPAPRYEEIVDMSDEVDPSTDRATFGSIGGIRGLTAIEGPVPGKQSLIFLWLSGRNSQGCVMRLDPQPNGSYTRVREACLANLISRHLDNAPIPYVVGAYNAFTTLRDPQSNEPIQLIGLQAFIPASPVGRRSLHLTAENQRNDRGGFYAGGMYAVRGRQGHWQVGEVNGRFRPGKPELVSVYTFAISPFGDADGKIIYVGGYDANYFPSSNTAWIFKTTVDTALREASAPK